MKITTITDEQFNALATLLRLREGSKSKRATRMVFVEGGATADVAKALDMPYADVARAIKAADRGLRNIKTFNLPSSTNFQNDAGTDDRNN